MMVAQACSGIRYVRSGSRARGQMVTQQVKAVKNTSKMEMIKIKSGGKAINTSSSFALCAGWMPEAADDALQSKQGNPIPIPSTRRGFPPPKAGATNASWIPDPRNHSGICVCPKYNVPWDPITSELQIGC